jgi:hypothetical protein
MRGPRFDRIIPLVTLVLVGLGVVFLLELNATQQVINPGEGLPRFSVAWALIGVVALVTGIGVELVARAQERLYTSGWITTVRFRQRQAELALPLWITPILTPIAAFAFFRLFRGVLETSAYLLVLLVTCVLLTIVLAAQHYLIDGTPPQRRVARTILNIIDYALAFAIFSAVAFSRYRTLYVVALIFPSALLLAADLLRLHVRALWTSAAIVALVTIQAYWTLNFWPTPFLLSGAALLVVFYVLIGLAQASGCADQRRADGSIQRQAGWEYGALGLVAFVALLVTTAWLRSRNIDLRGP